MSGENNSLELLKIPDFGDSLDDFEDRMSRHFSVCLNPLQASFVLGFALNKLAESLEAIVQKDLKELQKEVAVSPQAPYEDIPGELQSLSPEELERLTQHGVIQTIQGKKPCREGGAGWLAHKMGVAKNLDVTIFNPQSPYTGELRKQSEFMRSLKEFSQQLRSLSDILNQLKNADAMFNPESEFMQAFNDLQSKESLLPEFEHALSTCIAPFVTEFSHLKSSNTKFKAVVIPFEDSNNISQAKHFLRANFPEIEIIANKNTPPSEVNKKTQEA